MILSAQLSWFKFIMHGYYALLCIVQYGDKGALC